MREKKTPCNYRVQIKKGILSRELEGELVLLDTNSQEYFGLNHSGLQFWNAITSNESLQSALDILCEYFNASEEDLRKDLLDFIETMEEKKLLQTISPS